jgi:hypothetical protein
VTVLAPDIYRPDQWHDFFLTVGGGAAALTGLVFVAMSLNLGVIAQDATHRNRAIGTLVGFTGAFMICALAVMGGQDHVAVGIEWAVVAGIEASVAINGYIQAIRRGGSSVGLQLMRLVTGTACYVAEFAGALALTLGYVAGLYVAAIAMVIMLAFTISGAWLLIVGASGQQSERHGSLKDPRTSRAGVEPGSGPPGRPVAGSERDPTV